MRLARNHRSEPGNLLLLPFLNLCFLLAGFTLLLTRFVGLPGVAVSLPTSPFLTAPEQAPLGLSITAQPTPSIFLGDQRIAIDDLAKALAEIPAPRRTLVIRADRQVPFELVAKVSGLCLLQGVPVVLASSRPTP